MPDIILWRRLPLPGGVRALNGADWHGRALTVNEARPRQSRPAYSGSRSARRY